MFCLNGGLAPIKNTKEPNKGHRLQSVIQYPDRTCIWAGASGVNRWAVLIKPFFSSVISKARYTQASLNQNFNDISKFLYGICLWNFFNVASAI